MDTSETYIKMCDCGELQDKWSLCLGDYVFDKVQNEIIFFSVCAGNPMPVKEKYGSRYVWLPCQDQLQEMVFDKSPRITISNFVRWLPLYYSYEYGVDGSPMWIEQREYTGQFTSMEQLWLAFVQKEKYNKIWDGERWITEK